MRCCLVFAFDVVGQLINPFESEWGFLLKSMNITKIVKFYENVAYKGWNSNVEPKQELWRNCSELKWKIKKGCLMYEARRNGNMYVCDVEVENYDDLKISTKFKCSDVDYLEEDAH